GSPAQIAGLQHGDIIASIDGEPTITMEALQNQVASRNIGDTITLRVIRDGSEFITLTATLDRRIDTSFN
ncbi:MAG: PDZ domain-containing protein, partial [Defluviitaleaceae bacterium]|nr:PDZ domain-containing protein [Defluviitaleaceae bacterium]